MSTPNAVVSSVATRRAFLRNAALASGAIAAAGSQPSVAAEKPGRRPNVLMICADQFRPDFVGYYQENPSTRTPNLDAIARRGTTFRRAVCNQPLCSPSRASFLMGRYATETDVWKLGLEMDHKAPSIASMFRRNGYTSAFIGKWHVSSLDIPGDSSKRLGWIPPGPSRGGFDDLWEGANVLELVSHPYKGNYWDNDGKNIGFADEYRVDFITNRAANFIEQKHDKPWFLFLSQLEPHHQNDLDNFIPPKRYEGTFDDAFVPADLLALPGNWQTRLPGYYGCVQAIDDCVGKLVESLQKTGQLDNTVILFFSDHGNTFRTRLGEYKRSPHDSAIRVPFIVAGPGFDRSEVVDELVSLLDLAPTLLDSAGITPPPSMRGRSVLPLLNDSAVRSKWDSTAYIQISASMCGRALRTRDWSYSVYDPTVNPNAVPTSKNYTEFALYSVTGDPHQQTNLIGRPQYAPIAAKLRAELKRRIVEAGEPEANITPAKYYV